MANVGLTIEEGVANGASAFKEPSKRNIGLLGQFVRGASFVPTKITNLEDFNIIFGGQSSSFFGPGIVKSIFNEAGNAKVTLYVARVTGEGSVVANATASLPDSATMTATAGYKGSDDPGSWANGIEVSLYSYSSKVKDMFTLTISYKGSVVETYNYGTLSEIQHAVNVVSKYVSVEFNKEIEKLSLISLSGSVTATTSSNEVTGTSTSFLTNLAVGNVLYNASSKPIGTIAKVVSDTKVILTTKALVAVSAASVKKRNDVVYTATLAGGVDGAVTESDFYPVENSADPKGLSCFDGYDVQILACTEFHSLTMAKVLNEYVKQRKNPIGVVNLPLNADEGTAELYAMELQTNQTSFLAAYMGWCKVPDENGNPMLIPAIGPILGSAYLRTPYLQGDYIHIPPGGVDSVFNNVLEVIPARLSQNTINKLVQQFSCNIIQHVDGIGYYVGSSRTYSTNDLYQSIHIRLQTSYYLRVLESKLRFAEQKPNTPELKREILVELSTYFRGEYSNGALERSVTFEKAYQGICDKSNNPSTQDRKLLNVDILWIPTECTESIHVSLQRNDGILTSTELED